MHLSCWLGLLHNAGAELKPGDDYANLIYIHLAMDEGTGQSLKVRSTSQASLRK